MSQEPGHGFARDWEGSALGRREFLAGAAMLGLSATLAACGSSSSGSSSSGSTSTAASSAAAHLDRTGVLKFSMSTTIPGLDPQKWWNGAAACGQCVIYESLLTIDPYSSKLLPQLAASMPTVTNGGTRYTFKLRPGLKFSNGTALTSSDVKYSFERLIIPSFGAEAGSLYTALPITGISAVLNQKSKTLSGITTPDAQTVVFDFDHPDSTFVYLISLPMAGVVSQQLAESMGFNKYNWAPIGTGPFTADVVNRESYIILNRNASYWNPAVPGYAGVQWRMGIDDSLAMLRIQGGQDDMMYDPVPAGSVQTVLGNPDYVRDGQAVKTPQDNCYWMSLSLKDPLMKDVRVRRAIAMAINKPRVLQAMHALGQVADGGFFAPLSPYFQNGLAYSYDPGQAKTLLAQAGVKSGATIKMWSSNRFPYEAIGQVIQADLAAIGITAQYTPMEYDAFTTFTGNSPAGILLWAWELAYPSGSYIVDSAFTTAAEKAGCCDYPWFASAQFDSLATQAHRSTGTSQIEALYREMDRIVVQEEVLWVPLVYPVRLDFVSARVRDFQACVGGGEDQQRYFYKYALA
jgi:oligopeptide transport system substrate-binding protein